MSNSILNAAAAAALANGTLILSILGGSAYIGVCEARSSTIGQCDSQWLTGLALMGIGGGAKAGFKAGFNTLNPNLRSPGAPESPPTSPGSPAPPTTGKILRKRAEEAALGAAEDQVRAILSRGGR